MNVPKKKRTTQKRKKSNRPKTGFTGATTVIIKKKPRATKYTRRRRRKKFQDPLPIKISHDLAKQQQQQTKKKQSSHRHRSHRKATVIISRDAQQLMQHTRNSKVRWSPNDACFIIKGPKGKAVRKAGLGVMLRRTFWPDYDYRRVRAVANRVNASASKNLYRQAQLKANKNPERRSAAGLIWEDIPTKVVTGRGHKRRFERGTAVHEEICYYAREGLKKFFVRYPEPELYTLNIISALKKYGFTPIYAELPIYDEVVGYATAVDLLCVDQGANNTRDLGRLVICEIKTGYALNTFEQGHKEMLGAAAFMSNSCLNQARLQAYFAEMTLRNCYNISDCISVVLLVHDQGVAGFVVPDDIILHGSRMYRYAAAAETKRLASFKTSRRRGSAGNTRRRTWGTSKRKT